jgi:hypothetical protein
MKSSFLFLVIIICIASNQVHAQRKAVVDPVVYKKKIQANKANKQQPNNVTTVVPATPSVVPEPAAPKSPFDKFYDRLSIGYFSQLTTPPLEKWNSNHAALSPQFSGGDPCRNCDSYSMNLWNQVNFGYDFGAKMRFNVIPRFTVFLDQPSTQGPSERGMVLLEDALVGFSGVVYSSNDKKFNWWMRPGIRLPTSHGSRSFNSVDSVKRGPGFGRLSYNIEIINMFSYDFNTTWQLALTFQDRYWIYEQRYNPSRNRYYIAPNFTYTINQTTKIQGYYENMLENTNRWQSINGKTANYKNVWQNAYIGVAKDVTPKLNLYPFISSWVNDVPYSIRSFWLGMWISYQIK